MFRTLPLLLVACAASPANGWDRPRLAWSSTGGLLAAIQTWEHGTSSHAPWAAYVVIPEDLPLADFDRIHEALRSRGYEAPHSEPSMLDVTSNYTVRLALADPVGQPDITVTADVAQRLWMHDIPFGIEGGNSSSLILPRRAVPSAMRVLAALVHPETRWRR